MLRLLNQLIEPLDETAKMWDEFEKCDLSYFKSPDRFAIQHHLDDWVEAGSDDMMLLLQQIKKSYSSLRLSLASLHRLKLELIDTNRHEVRFFSLL